jgi:hypothetical protein
LGSLDYFVGAGGQRVALVPPGANAFVPVSTPADGSVSAAAVADSGPGHASAPNSLFAKATAGGDLRDYSVRMLNRRRRYSFRRCCDGSGKSGNSK